MPTLIIVDLKFKKSLKFILIFLFFTYGKLGLYNY